MSRQVMLLSVFLICVSCQRSDEPASTQPAGDATEVTTGVSAKEAYEQACAGCHEEGVDGAPRTGDRDAWVGRSTLWEAVLFEHAQEGYLDMPARGTDGRFSDEDIAAATEYMLELTHPDTPPD